MVKPSSLFALSVHVRLICEEEGAVALRLVGAAGGCGAVTVIWALLLLVCPALPVTVNVAV